MFVVFRRGPLQEIVDLLSCHTLKFCNVGDDCVQRGRAEFIVRGTVTRSRLSSTTLPACRRKTEFSKDFDYLKSTNNRVSRQ